MYAVIRVNRRGPLLIFDGRALTPPPPPMDLGLIARDAVLRAKGMLREALLAALDDEEAFDTWFGGHVTR